MTGDPKPGDPEPEVPFTEPWQAQVFGLTVHLNTEGVFTWPEWAEVFGAQLQRSDAAQDGSDYYQRWAAALEQLLEQKGLTTVDVVDNTAASWERAAEATPHGHAIVLANDPQRHETGSTGSSGNKSKRVD